MVEIKNVVGAVLALAVVAGAASPLRAQQQEPQRQQMRQYRVDPGADRPERGMMQQGPQGAWGRGMGPGMMGFGPSQAGQGYGPGPGMMGFGPGQAGQGYGPGPGMMGQGFGPGQAGQGYGPGPGMMGQGFDPGSGMAGPWHGGPFMMSPDEMEEMMEHMPGLMGGMMAQGYGPGMMARGWGPGRGAMGPGPHMGSWSGLAGQWVVPVVQLSTDDVRAFFERHLEALGNPRLQVGEVTALDGDTITAEVVTVDGSLVESFEVDRHTGLVSTAG